MVNEGMLLQAHVDTGVRKERRDHPEHKAH